MFSPRRAAQLGLLAALLTLGGCITVLIVLSGSPGQAEVPGADPAALNLLSQPSLDHPAQVATYAMPGR